MSTFDTYSLETQEAVKALYCALGKPVTERPPQGGYSTDGEIGETAHPVIVPAEHFRGYDSGNRGDAAGPSGNIHHLDCALTVDSHDPIAVGFRYSPQLFHVRPNELRPSFPKDAEHLGRFHPNLVILVMEELLENLYAAFVDAGCVCGDVLFSPRLVLRQFPKFLVQLRFAQPVSLKL